MNLKYKFKFIEIICIVMKYELIMFMKCSLENVFLILHYKNMNNITNYE